jgi:hypothetical protein
MPLFVRGDHAKMSEGLRELGGFVLVAAAMFAVILPIAALFSQSEEDITGRYARYCETAVNTPEDPYAVEQCTLTFKYGLQVTKYDLVVYHSRERWGTYPSALSEKHELMQQKLRSLLPLP